ncbi:Ig-like domain repeat protein [Methanobrevibacter sp.]|uniref:Ig-like domain repeat protein n=1 Tax=Methanobrevibacter sp. TaxID=66852 RepID=UPI002E79FA3D|nr:Ig-like domain repeat protein [Methanobrevibacter sp.]MEE1336394.1 Ig-like domain repeat protein [Methanobrevibacter sp.]
MITVAGKTYTDYYDFNVDVNNKIVTIMPKPDGMPVPIDAPDYDDPVIFSPTDYRSYLFSMWSNSQLIMSDIYISGNFYDAPLKFNTNLESTISECIFNNTLNIDRQPGIPISAQNSKLVLDGCTFESNGQLRFRNTVVNIDGCTFDSNLGSQGGAINADSSSYLTITDSEFTLNEATEKGGAIYASNLNINDTEFIGNYAPIGGAVYINDLSDSEVNITGCVFDSNLAENYRNIYSESLTRKINLLMNEFDLNLTILPKDGSYGVEYVMEGVFDWGCNLNNNHTLLLGTLDDVNPFIELVTIEDNKFNISMGMLPGGAHTLALEGMYTQEDSLDHFVGHDYYNDLKGNQFYLDADKIAFVQIVIEKAKIILNLEVENVLIPKAPVLNLYANFDENFTVFLGTTVYHVQVVDGKASLELTGLDLGNYTVVAMRSSDENFDLALNFTTFSVGKIYSNFLVVSTNVEYATLNEAVANSDDDDTILIKKGTYGDTGIVISNKTLNIMAVEGAVFDAQGRDANFIIVQDTAEATIYGITFRGIHNRNTNYGAIVNHGYLTVDSCNFTDNEITKTSFAENGGAAIFSDGELLEIKNCSFINNVAPLKVSTAAVTSLGYEDVTITDSKFINNTAREGGALYFKNLIQFEAAVASCDFEQNTAVKGSAIYVGNNSVYVRVTFSSFNKNDIKNNKGETTQLEGGVIYVNANDVEVTLDIDLSSFEDNSNKDVDGGVICLDGISNANIDTCTFNNNKGKTGSVILVKNPYNEKLRLFVDSSIFTNNAATKGTIATSPRVTAFLDDCIIGNNTGEYRNIYSDGFTVAHDTTFDVKGIELTALNVKYGESSVISGTADIGANIYAAANLTVAGENVIVEIKDNAFTYNTGILNYGKYYVVLNDIVDNNNNTYIMDSVTKIFRVSNAGFDLNVSVDNITYGESIKVTETLPANAAGTISYQLNGINYTKGELEALKLDAGKYTLVALYDNEDLGFAYALIDFEVNKAIPTISVADVEVGSGENITVNIVTNVPSIYIIEIGDYNLITLINGSKSIEVDKTFAPGTYTIKVTSQERVNYLSGSAEATLTVNGASLGTTNNVLGQSVMTSPSGSQSPIDEIIINEENFNNLEMSSQNDLLIATNNDIIRDEETGNFIYQEDEDDDPQYFDTLEEAIDEASLMGGIITVRGGTYRGYGFCGIEIEGELEITIRAYPGEEVIFDCEGEDYFLYLTYDTEVEVIEAVPPIPIVYTTEGPTITLENITVTNGYNSEGGAIELVAGTLTLTNCNFTNNNADYGGAICVGSTEADQDATLIAVNCTFTGNVATEEGGAFYFMSNLEQTSSAAFAFCTFLDNFQGEEGNRVMNYFGGEADELTRKYCVFNGTGEIYNVIIDKINQTVTVNGTSPDIFGSVVLLYQDTLPVYTINNKGAHDFYVTFENVIGGNYTIGTMDEHDFNTYVFGAKFEMKVPNFFISADEVFENLTDAIDAVPENGIIYANLNYHIDENMEIEITKSFTLKNYNGRMVIFDGNTTQWFFTVAKGCNVVFEGINFTDGGIKEFASFENNGNLTFKNCIITGFETEAIVYNTGFLNISCSDFSDNFLNNAIVLNSGKLSIDSTVFAGNIINISSVILNNGIADIISSNFTENTNYGNGGAIYSTNSLNIIGSVFRENEGIDGGAVYNAGTMKVQNSSFEDNTANGYGGAIYNDRELTIADSLFTGGFSEKDGGAIYNNNVMNADNSTFAANTATGTGGAIYNNATLVLTDSFFGINFGEEFANIYNAGDIQFTGNIFDFYDVILHVPSGEYGIPSIITGTLDPQFNMDLQLLLPGFVNNTDVTVSIQEGIFEYNAGILPKGVYDVKLDEIIYDTNGNIYCGEAVIDRLIITRANVYINITVEDIVLRDATQVEPVLKINASKDGIVRILFINKFLTVNITGGFAEITLDSVEEGNYSVMAFREGDENYNDAVNTTKFEVMEYETNFIVNSTGQKFDRLSQAVYWAAENDIIYVNEGTYSPVNFTATVAGKKLTIIALGAVFDANSTDYGFLTVRENADVTIEGITFTGFNSDDPIIHNEGKVTVDGCIFVNNTLGDSIINSFGKLNIVESEFYDNNVGNELIFVSASGDSVLINESTFENNIINNDNCDLISIMNANSAKIISSEFVENKATGNIISVALCSDVLIDSVFANNTQGSNVIFADKNSNLLVENSIFTGNELANIIFSTKNNQTISECTFADNAVENVVYSKDNNLSVLGSTFSSNTLSGNGALNIQANVSATVDGCMFTGNKADNYRNIYSVSTDVNITNTVFDAINVDLTVQDIDYGLNETIEGTIDIGTNLNFTANLEIKGKIYSVNVTDNKFTHNLKRPSAGDYTVILDTTDSNLNSFIFNKITKIFTVNRVEQVLKVIIDDITYGEKLNVTVFGNRTSHVVFELNGKTYTNETLQNLTLAAGDYLIVAKSSGDKNYLPATAFVHVKVHKIAPVITVSDVEVNYGNEIKVDVSANAPDYYTVFIGDESVTLPVEDQATFTFNGTLFKPGTYEIKAYVFESENYTEAYANATLTVNKSDDGFFRLSNGVIGYGENATIRVTAPVNAYGNITYTVYQNEEVVYTIKQSCLEDLVVPNLKLGTYIVTGTFEGDSYYTNKSKVNSTAITVIKGEPTIDIDLENITGSTPSITVKLPEDATGNVSIYINGELKQIVNVVNGSAVVNVTGLKPGNNTVTVVYSGDGNYSSVNKSAVVKNNASIISSDMTRGYNSGLDYTATLFDAEGFPLANEKVTVKVDTNTYTVQTDSNGVLRLNNKLAVGNHAIVIINPVTGEYKLNNLNIAARITGNKNVKIFFADNSKYTVRIVGDDGNYVGAGEVVKMNVGGKTYSVKTDANGYATLKLSLKVKKHTITITYKGFTTKNTVTVKSVVKPLKKLVKLNKKSKSKAKKTTKAKKKSKYLKIKVKLKGKKVLKKKRVYMKFKGKTYKAKTNKKGIATFKVPKKVTKKLKKGKKYKATFTYKVKANGKTLKNTAKCYVKRYR